MLFYEKCLPHIRPRTYKMDAGREEHDAEQKRALRRSFSKYEVEGGRRIFDLALEDGELHLRAKMDEVVTTHSGEVFPVDYKLAEKVGENHKYQLTAYAMMLEAWQQTRVRRAFLYLIPKQRAVEIAISDALRNQVRQLLQQMTHMVEQEAMPAPTDIKSRCIACEFRRFCNDVL